MSRTSPAILGISLLFAYLAVAGCTGSDSATLLAPGPQDVAGDWTYLVTNAVEARFASCTGDAAVLEGRTLYEAQELAPVCLVAGAFRVLQSENVFLVEPHDVTCSDGVVASVSGSGTVDGSVIAGRWESTSGRGVTAVQLFSGRLTATGVEIEETGRTFSGRFNGSCSLAPPLKATALVR